MDFPIVDHLGMALAGPQRQVKTRPTRGDHAAMRTPGQEPVLDSRLLGLLDVLLAERSVSRTAARLGQSPPAVSVALRRLRRLLGDPILVRSGSKLVPTERAQSLAGPVRRALESIEEIVSPDELFDPRADDRQVRVALADCMGPLLLPQLLLRLRAAAPGVRLVTRAVEPEFDYAHALEEGELDIAIGCWERPPRITRVATLIEDEIVCLVRRDHPLTRGLLPDGRVPLPLFAELDHLVRSLNQITCPGLIADCLAEHGVERRIGATVPEFSLAPSLLLGSDLVFSTGRLFAEHWARLLPLTILKAPAEIRPMRTCLLWHDRTHRSRAGRWLRELVHEAAIDLRSRACDPAPPSRPGPARPDLSAPPTYS